MYWLGRNRLYLQITNRVPNGVTSLYHARGPGFTLPNFTPITTELTPKELAKLIDVAYESDERKIKAGSESMGESDEGVVFAGIGEPLLRLDDLVSTTEMIKESRHGIVLRLNTCGLGLSPSLLSSGITRLVDAGLGQVSVFIPSAKPGQYEEFMKGHSLGTACSFVSTCVEQGLTCKVVTVSNPKVDVKAVKDLGAALGAVEFESKCFYK